MNTFLFLERELLGAIRARSGLHFGLTIFFLLVFLGSFASFFLFPAAPPQGGTGLAANEIVVLLSPRLSATTIDDLYVALQERDDVLRVQFDFPEEVSAQMTGGRFTLAARSISSVEPLVEAVGALDGVIGTQVGEPVQPMGVMLSSGAKIGLLAGLLASAVISLLLSRWGFRSLLQSFRSEIRMMRLAGLPAGLLYPPLVGLGVLMGFLAGLLLLAGIFLLPFAAPHETATLPLGVGRLLTVGLVSLALALTMGALIGLFGAGQLSSRHFDPL